jgi:hypothetical protein
MASYTVQVCQLASVIARISDRLASQEAPGQRLRLWATSGGLSLGRCQARARSIKGDHWHHCEDQWPY